MVALGVIKAVVVLLSCPSQREGMSKGRDRWIAPVHGGFSCSCPDCFLGPWRAHVPHSLPPFLPADIIASSDIEEFLREAACMKEFDHPHVAKLVGEPLLQGGRCKIGLKLCSPDVRAAGEREVWTCLAGKPMSK